MLGTRQIISRRRPDHLASGAKAPRPCVVTAGLKPRPSGSAAAEGAANNIRAQDAARPKAWLAWSSGKDSAWALHTVRLAGEYEVVALLTTMNRTHARVAMHAVRESLLEMQAAAAGLRLVKVPIPSPCPNEIYEAAMSEAMGRARDEGVRHVIFGDLFLEDIRAYREQQLAGCGMTPVFPLWGIETRALARQMIAGGLSAYLTCVDPRQLGASLRGGDLTRSCWRSCLREWIRAARMGSFTRLRSRVRCLARKWRLRWARLWSATDLCSRIYCRGARRRVRPEGKLPASIRATLHPYNTANNCASSLHVYTSILI